MNDTVIKAILKINPNAELSVSDNNVNTIVWENVTTPIPKADIEAKMVELPTPGEEATERENNKTSAQNKLKALGLTDAEIEAL